MNTPAMPTADWATLRNEFPTAAHFTYLDVARKMIPPRCQEQAVAEYFRDVYEEAGADAWAATNVALGRMELAALLVIASLPIGGWSGLDYFLRSYCPWAGCCAATAKEVPR